MAEAFLFVRTTENVGSSQARAFANRLTWLKHSIVLILLLWPSLSLGQAVDMARSGLYIATEAGATCSQATLSAAITNSVSNHGSIPVWVPTVDRSKSACTWSITSNFSPAVPLVVPQGARIDVASGATLTLSASPIAGDYQIFGQSDGNPIEGTVLIASVGTEGVKVAWFGGLGNGTTDNTVPFAKATTAILGAARGGTLEIPAGVFHFNNSAGANTAWTIAKTGGAGIDGLHIKGSNIGSTWLEMPMDDQGDKIIDMNCDSTPCRISNLLLRNSVVGNFGICLDLHGNGMVADNLWASGCTTNFDIEAGTALLSNMISELTVNAFRFDSPSGMIQATNMTAYNASIGFVFRQVIPQAYPDFPVTCTNCYAIENTQYGFLILDKDNVTIHGCAVHDSTLSADIGIYVEDSHNLTVADCEFNNIAAGILAQGATSGMTITGNRFLNLGSGSSSGVGVELNSSAVGWTISNNQFKNLRLSAIKQGDSALLKIVNNTFVDYGVANVSGNNHAILLYGEGATKSAHIEGNTYTLNAGDRAGVAWDSDTDDGLWLINGRELSPGITTLYDFTNAPSGTYLLTGIQTGFANLPAAQAGSLVFCPDCTHASSPCTGSGSGAFAKRIGPSWQCD